MGNLTSTYIMAKNHKDGLKRVKDPQSYSIIDLQCSFYYVFGGEMRAGQKRKPTANLQSWSFLFWYDNIEGHIFSQHAVKWKIHKTLETNEEQEDFFSDHS